ncbi:ribosome-binding protein [Naganishia albida]|nr:ribosome-binding protein [Naganishia albida]
MASAMHYVPDAYASQTAILCAECGTVIQPNGANMCIGCLRNSVDITEGIPKETNLNNCRGCERWFAPPANWQPAALESQELLSICLKKIAKPLSKVRLINAKFLWTEPHSKRLKVEVTIQKEILTNTVLQQTFVLLLIVHGGQCPDCARLAAKNTWKASVQVRQKVNHKRTFLFLEQLILKHNAHKDCLSISEKRDGLDFFYADRNSAIKMTEFLNGVVPIRIKASEQLISSDTHNNTANYKFTYSIEIVPICKDDLVVIPPKLAKQWGNINPLTFCSRVGNSIHLMDPSTLQHTDVTAPLYWRQPFDSLATVRDLVEFIVLDIEPSGPVKGKFVLADAQVVRNSGSGATAGDEDGMGGGDGIFHTRTHLGAILQPGDTVLGFHISKANYNSDAFESLDPTRTPDVVLVKKTYPNRRKKSKPRNWKLKSIAVEADDNAHQTGGVGRGALGRRGGVDSQKVEKDYELFLRDLEEDPEFRSAVNLYKADKPSTDVNMTAGSGLGGKKQKTVRMANDMDVEEDEAEEQPDEDDDMEEEEADFPDIELHELLEDLAIEEEPEFGPQEDAE